MIRSLQNLLLFLHELTDFPKFLCGKTGIEQNVIRFGKRYFRFAVLASGMDMKGFHRIAFI